MWHKLLCYFGLHEWLPIPIATGDSESCEFEYCCIHCNHKKAIRK